MLVEKIYDYKRSKIKNYPVHANRASEAGHPCLRYLVFNRTRWEEKILPPLEKQLIFDEGNIQEQAILRDIQDAGIKVIEQQRPFTWPKFELTGMIDAKIAINGLVLPVEIKSLSPYLFNTINSEDDLLKSKYWYVRRYPAQIQLYMIMDSSEFGLLILKNKVNGQLKEILFKLNYEYTEEILKKLEVVNEHVKKGTLPSHQWDDDICPDCSFLHICLPEKKSDGLQILDNQELELKLNRLEELKPLAKEYEELYADIKKEIEGKEKIVVGDWLITGKWVQNNGGIKEIKPYKYWLPKILKLKEGNKA